MTDRLLVAADSALITSDIVELLAEHAGKSREADAVAEVAVRGESDVAESLRRRVAALEGLPVSVVYGVLDSVRLTPGARNLVETLHGRGWSIALVSMGFGEVIAPLAARLGISLYLANGLRESKGVLTGTLAGPIVDRGAKARALVDWAEALNIPLEDTVAIGNDESDVDMLAAAGFSIAFNAAADIEAAADVSVTSTRLDAVLDHLS
jgi:phosphoserine phosphatase